MGDADLTLDALHAERPEPDAALAAADAVEPTDQDMTRRRELVALRAAVQAGRIDRVRQAADRLCGLRLDAPLPIQLAAQRRQLGQHGLADAVLAHVGGHAGNNSDVLVQLMIQYERQGNAKAAALVASDIVNQRTAPVAIRPGRYSPSLGGLKISHAFLKIQIHNNSEKFKYKPCLV